MMPGFAVLVEGYLFYLLKLLGSPFPDKRGPRWSHHGGQLRETWAIPNKFLCIANQQQNYYYMAVRSAFPASVFMRGKYTRMTGMISYASSNHIRLLNSKDWLQFWSEFVAHQALAREPSRAEAGQPYPRSASLTCYSIADALQKSPQRRKSKGW